MSNLRLVFTVPRFWPMVGEIENGIADLAAGLHRYGDQVTILTPQRENSWPTEVEYEEFQVVRLPFNRGLGLGTLRYSLTLGRWLQQHRENIDAVCVSGLGLDAVTTLRALRRHGLPVVLRADRSGPRGDVQRLLQSRFASRLQRQCSLADMVVATHAAAQLEVLSHGFSPGQVHRIGHGIAPPSSRGSAGRSEARTALAKVNSDLKAKPDAFVVVYAGRLGRQLGLANVLKAWRRVHKAHRSARLWLIGEGPYRDDLFQLICDWDLRSSVCMPGSFDDISDVLTAANLFVQPGEDVEGYRSLLAAAVAGVPVLIPSFGSVMGLPGIGERSRRFEVVADEPNGSATLSEAILLCMGAPQPMDDLAFVRRAVLREHSVRHIVGRYRELFCELIARHSNG